MPRRLLLPGLLLVSALTSVVWAGQEPPPPPQPYPTAPVALPPLNPPPATPPAQTIPTQAPLPSALGGAPAAGIVPAAVPPEALSPDEELRRQITRLQQEIEALTVERKDLENRPGPMPNPDALELARLRQRLGELLQRLEKSPPSQAGANPAGDNHKAGSPTQPGNPTRVADLPPVGNPAQGDPSLQAQTLFRAGHYQEALTVFRSLQPESLSPSERLLVQYLSACCLRRLGKLDEAIALYREVADAREDAYLEECSLWHLTNINWRRDIEKQLAAIRAARQGH